LVNILPASFFEQCSFAKFGVGGQDGRDSFSVTTNQVISNLYGDATQSAVTSIKYLLPTYPCVALSIDQIVAHCVSEMKS